MIVCCYCAGGCPVILAVATHIHVLSRHKHILAVATHIHVLSRHKHILAVATHIHVLSRHKHIHVQISGDLCFFPCGWRFPSCLPRESGDLFLKGSKKFKNVWCVATHPAAPKSLPQGASNKHFSLRHQCLHILCSIDIGTSMCLWCVTSNAPYGKLS